VSAHQKCVRRGWNNWAQEVAGAACSWGIGRTAIFLDSAYNDGVRRHRIWRSRADAVRGCLLDGVSSISRSAADNARLELSDSAHVRSAPVSYAARRTKVPTGVHILRHTFCSHLAMQGAPVRAIQELAGHQELSMTQPYTHLSPVARESAIRLLDQPLAAEERGKIVERVEGANVT
jgi:integrase